MKNALIIGIIIVCGLLASACNKKSIQEDEKFSPQIHFSLKKNWTGEPTGLVYYKGEYHLFYQYNPTQAVFGNIHWGHAVSKDLLHWENLPVALSPDRFGEIYSGSVIVDLQNTSGFGSKENPPFIAFFTYHKPENATKKESEHSIQIAYSLDKGRTWTKQEKPVLSNSKYPVFRNPNITWNDLSGQWLMTVSTGTTIQFYSSPDCIQWSFLCEFGENAESEGGWEGSGLFPVKINDSDSTKWVLLVNMNEGTADGAPGIRYFVGDFDGATFRMTQGQKLWVDYGKDNFAGMIFNNARNDRKIMLGWMNCWEYANLTPNENRRGSITFPREIQLVTENNYYLLTSNPVKELDKLSGASDSIGEIKFNDEKHMLSQFTFPTAPFMLRLTFDNTGRHAIWNARDYGIRFKTKSGTYLSVGYKAELNYFYIDRSHLRIRPFSDFYEKPTGAIYTHSNPVTDWDILVDNGSVELFTCGGRVVMTALVNPDDSFDSFELYSESGNITLLKASITTLKVNSKSDNTEKNN